MPDTPALLIIGSLPPADHACASLTVHTALHFSEHVNVTVVISDYATPPINQEGYPFTVLRERDLRQQQRAYANAQRLYILGDTYESLFAFNLLQEAPGALLTTNENMHTLWRCYLETKPDWPENYRTWLKEELTDTPDAADTVVNAIIISKRVSKEINTEIPALDTINKTSTWHMEIPLPFTNSATVSPHSITEKTADVQVVSFGSHLPEKSIAELAILGHDISHTHLSGYEACMAKKLAEADIVIIISDTSNPPPAFTGALLAGKAVIAAGKWTTNLPPDIVLVLKHTYAQQELTAALGALLKPELREWLCEGACAYRTEINLTDLHKAAGDKLLTEHQKPLSLTVKDTFTPLVPTTVKTPHIEGQVAFIGPTPPEALLSEVFPALNAANSPRFATPELAAALSVETGLPASIVTAQLGYESSLISVTTSSANNGHVWEDIQAQLKTPLQAYSFTTAADGIEHIMIPQNDIPLRIEFPLLGTNKLQLDTHGFLPESGCFWYANLTEQRIRCLLVASGMTACTLSQQENSPHKFVVTTHSTTSMLDSSALIQLDISQHQIVSFDIALFDTDTQRHASISQLFEALAQTGLLLRPLRTKEKSEMVTA